MSVIPKPLYRLPPRAAMFSTLLLGLVISCAPDATKSFNAEDDNVGKNSKWDDLPELTAARLEAAMAKCGLSEVTERSANVFSGSYATPGPLAWNHESGSCDTFSEIFGKPTTLANVVVRPKLSLQGGFLTPELDFQASHEINSNCPQKFTEVAAKDAAPFQRSVKYQVVPLAERPGRLGQVGPWKKVICAMAAVSSLSQTRGLRESGGQGRVEVEFSPALPALPIAMIAKSGAILGELRRPVQFDNITAKVKSSSDPSVSAGREYTGSVIVELVAANKSVVDIDQNTQTDINTDLGIRITNNIGGNVQTTLALGMFPWIEFFIEKSSGTIKYISTYNPDQDPKRSEILYK